MANVELNRTAARFEKPAAYWAKRGDLGRAAQARRTARLERQTAQLEHKAPELEAQEKKTEALPA